MSGGISNIGKAISKFDPLRGGDKILEGIGLPTWTGDGEKNIMDMGQTAALAEAKRQADAQAQATRDAANTQAAATRAASAQQADSLQQQAVAAAQAQQSTINQAATAAQQAAQLASTPQEGTPDVQLGSAGSASDPRRKYQGGGAASVGGTSGGIGIRL